MSNLILCGMFTLFLGPANNVETIDNGQKPEGKATIEFTEELRLGPDSGEEYHEWSGATVNVEANSAGHIFVVDTGGNRIVEFDKDGKFIRQIGKLGQGPGEFQFLKSFRIFKDGTAVAFDDMNAFALFNKYDKSMTYLDREQKQVPAGALESLTFSPDGKFMASFYQKYDQSGATTFTAVLNDKLEPVIELSERRPPQFNPQKVSDGAWWSEFYAGWFGLVANGLGLAAFDHDGNIYTALTNKYEITRWDSNLKKTRIIRRNAKPIVQNSDDLMAFSDPIRAEILASLPAQLRQFITPNVVTRAIEKADFPPNKQPIFGMVPMENGGLLVVHDFNPKNGKSSGDIFDKNGKFVGTTALPKVAINFFGTFFGDPVKLKFKDGKAYAIEVNEDGEPTLVRYKATIKGM